MACLGVKPGAARWKAQTSPLSYGGTQKDLLFLLQTFPSFINNFIEKVKRWNFLRKSSSYLFVASLSLSLSLLFSLSLAPFFNEILFNFLALISFLFVPFDAVSSNILNR